MAKKKLLHRLLNEQLQCCFFCRQPLPKSEASIEHLHAKATRGKTTCDECVTSTNNQVACCKTLNQQLADKPLKEKLRFILGQAGGFKCPQRSAEKRTPEPSHVLAGPDADAARVVEILRKKGKDKRPKNLPKLTNFIAHSTGHPTDTAGATAIVKRLKSAGKIKVAKEGQTITYAL